MVARNDSCSVGNLADVTQSVKLHFSFFVVLLLDWDLLNRTMRTYGFINLMKRMCMQISVMKIQSFMHLVPGLPYLACCHHDPDKRQKGDGSMDGRTNKLTHKLHTYLALSDSQWNKIYFLFYSTHSFSMLKPGDYITHNATWPPKVWHVFTYAVAVPNTWKHTLMCKIGGVPL